MRIAKFVALAFLAGMAAHANLTRPQASAAFIAGWLVFVVALVVEARER